MKIDPSPEGRRAFLERGLAHWTSAEVEARARGDEDFARIAGHWSRNYERALERLTRATSETSR